MIKVCEGCAKEFKPKQSKVRFCSYECGKISSTEIARKNGEEKFRKNFDTRFTGGFEYVSGYSGCESSIVIKCFACGELLNRGAHVARRHKPLTCEICIRIKQERLTTTRRLDITHKKAQRELERPQRERERSESKRIEREEWIRDNTKIKKCKQCGDEYATTLDKSVYCSTQCGDKHSSKTHELRRRHRLSENGKVDYTITLDKLIKRDKSKCNICGEKVDVGDYIIDKDRTFIAGNHYPSVDHIRPVSKGGAHTWDNVQLAHRHCNSTKSNHEVYDKGQGQLTLAI